MGIANATKHTVTLKIEYIAKVEILDIPML